MAWKRWVSVTAGYAFAAAMYRRRKAWADAPRISTLKLPGDGGHQAGYEFGSLRFIGTATTLIRYGGFTLLTDPNFLRRGQRIRFGPCLRSTRLTEPALQLEELPPIDLVVLSHLREDHFDREVARRLPKSTPILTTPEASAALRRKGFRRAYGVDRWGTVEVRKGAHCLRLTAMPATPGFLPAAALAPEVMGSMLDFRNATGDRRLRLYISGDTLVSDRLHEIPRRFPEIDLALLHLGGTRILGMPTTMDAEQGVQALEIVAPRLAIPIHFNDYTFFRSPLAEFERAAARAGLQDRVLCLNQGETFEFRPADLASRRDLGPSRTFIA